MAISLLFIWSWLALLCDPCVASSQGKEFVNAFLNNFNDKENTKFVLFITGYHPTTKVTVTVKKPAFQKTISVNNGQTMSVQLPIDIEIKGTIISDGTVRIQADKKISVFSYNYKEHTSGATTVYPVDQLGTLYYVITPAGIGVSTFKEFAVIAYRNPTKVTIHLKGRVTFKGQDYPPGSKLVADLKPFQTIQLQSTDDLSGSKVESNEPVAVLSGHRCTKKFTSCDHVVEQLLPVGSWGTKFIVPSLSFQSKYDIVYIIASQNALIKSQSGSTSPVSHNVKAGQLIQLHTQTSQPLFISANAGIQVLFFFTGATSGNMSYDPFLINVPAITHYCTSYHIDGMKPFENYAVLMAKTSESSRITIQKATIGNLKWRPIPGTEYSWAEQKLSKENSAVSLGHPNTPFGLLTLGVSQSDGYGSVAVCSSRISESSCSSIQCRKQEVCKILNSRPVCVPQSESTCWAHGDPHYHTFDGRNFDFMGTCTYTITKTCGLDRTLPSFSVEAKNEIRGGNTHVSYVGLVTVRIYNTTISMARNEIGFVRVNYHQTQLPFSLHEGKLRVYQSGGSAFIETDFALKVSYDWNSYLVVKISSSFAENLCGLCGDYNGDPANDFRTPDGNLAPSPEKFGHSWKVKDGDRFCHDDCKGGCKTCPPETANKYKAEAFCGLISKGGNGPFSLCHSVVDPSIFLDNCVYDLCLMDGFRRSLCDALKSYADACQRQRVTVSDWRTPSRCTLPCPENSQYKACGSPCPATCNDQAGPSKCSSLPCVETCQCNDGFVLDAGKCIPKASCGCIFEGKHFSPGEQFWGDSTCSRHCICDPRKKKVTCKTMGCKPGEQCRVEKGIQNCYPTSNGTCSASGDPHYISFDGRKFDYQGTCLYKFTGLCKRSNDLENFQVIVENDHRGSKAVSFTKRVGINIYGNSIVITREYPAKVMVNGFLISLPYRIGNNQVFIYRRGQEAVVQTDFFLTVTFDWQSRITVTVPGSYAGALCGLCGNFNGDKEDDLLMRDGTLAPNPTAFGQNWKVQNVPGCTDGSSGECPGLTTIEKQQRTLNRECGLLLDRNGPFRDCHSKVDPQGYFQDCVYDYCFFKGQQAVICKLIASYVAACHAAGATLYAWRSDSFCSLPCGRNSHYDLCASDCAQTCGSLYVPIPCTGKCQESCVCNEGFMLSGDQCVPLSQCGCYYQEKYYLAGETFYPTCQERCTCQAGGIVTCKALACGPHEECRLEKGIQKCYPVGSATCSVAGGIHYISFDQLSFDFHGTCTYTMAKTKTNNPNLSPFTVNVANEIRESGKISVPKMVSISIQGITLTFLKNKPGQVKVDDTFQLLPVSLSGGRLKVYQHGTKVLIQDASGLSVSYDFVYRVSVTLPSTYQDQVSGLCGNYNDKKGDDFLLPDGRMITDVTTFGAAWKVLIPGADGSCLDGCPGNKCPVCKERKKEVFKQRNYCGILTADDSPLSACHVAVDPNVYLNNCIYDLCLVDGNSEVLCHSIQSYVSACQDAEVSLNPWRTQSLCSVTCPANSHYEVCANLCSVSCAKITDQRTCPDSCAEGCQCDDGFFFDGRDCVSVENCGCFKNGHYFKPNKKVLLNDCKEICTCIPGQGVKCEAHTCTADEKCGKKDGVMICIKKAPSVASSNGKEFVTAFLNNQVKNIDIKFVLFITGYHPTTMVTVTVKKPAFQKTISVNNGQTMSVQLPIDIEIKGTIISDGTVRIQADKEISVFSYNHKEYSTGATTVYPVDQLGTLYYVITPEGNFVYTFKEFAVIAYRNPTKVTIHLKGRVTFKGQDYPPGSKLVADLKPFQTIQLQSTDDLSGSKVESNEPVAVLSGHSCAKKFTYCDHVVEQLLPVYSWGTNFIVPSLSFQSKYDIVYIIASQNALIKSQSGSTPPVSHNVKAGQLIQLHMQTSQPLFISADAGIQVLFFFPGATSGSITYDPFLINVPAITHYCTSYHIDGMKPFENYAVLIAKTSESSRITIQKATIGNLQWRPIPGTEYSWAEQRLGIENRALSLEDPSTPFGLFTLGTTQYDTYGSVAVCSSNPCKDLKCQEKETCKIENNQAKCVPTYQGTCWAWGDPHYQTFDGLKFDFQGTCTYIFAKYCGNDPTLIPFTIDEKNDNRGNQAVSYVRLTNIHVYGYKISIYKQETGRIRLNDAIRSLPVTLEDGKIKLYQSGDSAVLKTDFGLQVTYDWNWHLIITLPSTYAGAMCGLCGNFNQNPGDDIAFHNGTKAPSIERWASSWRNNDRDPFCWDSCQGNCPTCEEGKKQQYGKKEFCGLISESSGGPFRECHAKVKPADFLDSCIYDVCQNGGAKNILCQALEAYAKTCRKAGAIIYDWRTPSGCALQCPENSHYEFCGNACPASCGDRNAPAICKLPCVESCQCNDGFVLSVDKCVPVASCGCTYNGFYYKPGEQFWTDERCGSRCKCDPNRSKVVCNQMGCKANERCMVVNGIRDCYSLSYSTCLASGDPHYATFDGRKYDFMGTCIYQLAGLCSTEPNLRPFTVYVQNNNRGNIKVSYTKIVTLEIYNVTIMLSQEYPRRVQVNSVFVNLPFNHEDKVKVYISGNDGVIRTNFGLTVTFDWDSYVRVTVPNTYANALCGLCGNNNQNPHDDFTMKDGRQAGGIAQFAESWKVADVPGCSVGCTDDCPACPEAQKQIYQSDQYCGIIRKKDGPFKQCHGSVDPTPYFTDCIFDTCQYKGQHGVLCKAIAIYVAACQAQGIQIAPWRLISFCSPNCRPNSHYELCGNGCPATCYGLGAPASCEVSCKEGCYCDAGFVLSGDQCVHIEDCGCVYQDKYYKKGEYFYPSASCQERCLCNAIGFIECEEISCRPSEICKVKNGVQGCHPTGSGQCSVAGGSHFLTFDRRAYDFHGTCTYILAQLYNLDSKLTNFSVLVENTGSWTKRVVVSVHGFTVIMEREMTWKVKVDGEFYTLPMSSNDGKLWVNQEGNNIIVQADFSLKVLYDTSSYVLVSIPKSYQGHVNGLCGNFNVDSTDDFKLPNGKSTQNKDVFGASWKVPIEGARCLNGCGMKCPKCDATQIARYRPKSPCGIIQATSGPFRACHFFVNPSEYYNNCLHDMCVTNGDGKTLCRSIQAYVAACQAAGTGVESWRSNTFCPLSCQPNSHYELCTRNCDATCTTLATPGRCTQKCFEGCQCDSGYLFDGNRCVAVENCGCVHDGRYIKVGESIILDGCLRKCTCRTSGLVICEEMKCQAEARCALQDGVRSCIRGEGKCLLTPGAQLISFDGASGRILHNGAYEVASLCDGADPSWFRIVAIIQTCSNEGLAAVSTLHVFFKGTSITVKRNQETWVNGYQVELPAKVSEDLSIGTSEAGVTIKLDAQVHVFLALRGEVSVQVRGHLQGKVCASCGNFNGNAADDLKLPNGNIARNIAEVIGTWKAKDFSSCDA